ncbi:MAG TPA: cytochrome c [Bryobacteraceae bacterium]|jgi:cytochrome c oxidase cbb3-type subunit 3
MYLRKVGSLPTHFCGPRCDSSLRPVSKFRNLCDCFVFAAVVLSSAVAIQAQTTTPVGSATRGQKQFQQSCAFCHGSTAGGGAEGPNLIRSSLVRHDKNGELIGQVIREGRPEKGMPAIPLNAQQIADVVAFLHERLKETDRTSYAHPNADLKLLLTGDAEEGKAFFNGAGGCAGCHSPTDDLSKIASKFSPADLQTRFLYPVGQKPTAVITLHSGQKFEGELVRTDAFHAAIIDKDGWFHSWPLSEASVEVDDPLAAHRALLLKLTNPQMHNLFAYLETLK